MRITYDTKADALYISLHEGVFQRNREVEQGVVLDLGPNDELLGIEILNAATRLDLSDIAKASLTEAYWNSIAVWEREGISFLPRHT